MISVLTVNADTKKNISGKAEIFNTSQISNVLHVHLPMDPYNLGELQEIVPVGNKSYGKTLTPIDLSECTQFTAHPWLDINTSALDLSVGFHLYRLTYNNATYNTTVYIFFNYIIQDDNPERPYIYMETEEEAEEDSSTDDADTNTNDNIDVES